jgi:hypothetical protein
MGKMMEIECAFVVLAFVIAIPIILIWKAGALVLSAKARADLKTHWKNGALWLLAGAAFEWEFALRIIKAFNPF